MIFRFLGGVGVGAASVVCAHLHRRDSAPGGPRTPGRPGPVQHRARHPARLRVQLRSSPRIAADDVAWRWMFGVMAVPAAIFLLLLATVPETPRWLLSGRPRPGGRGRPPPTVHHGGRGPVRAPARSTPRSRPRRTPKTFRSSPAQHRKVILLAYRDRGVQPTLRDQRDPLLRARGDQERRRVRQRGAVDERRRRVHEPDRHDGSAERDRQDRPAKADDRRLDRLPDQPHLPGRRPLRIRRQLQHHLRGVGSRRAAGVHRRARVRPGLGDLGVHLRDLPEPDTRSWPVPGQPDPLGVRRADLRAFPPIVGALGGGVGFSIFRSAWSASSSGCSR